MKKITAFILVFAIILCMPVFAQGTLSGNTLYFEAPASNPEHTFTLPADELALFHSDSAIHYYSFNFGNLTVRADKNCFYAHNLDRIEFKISERSFDATYFYKDGNFEVISEVVNPLRFTLSGVGMSLHNVAKFGEEIVNCLDSNENQFVFETKKLGSFTPIVFEFPDVAKAEWYYSYVNRAGAYGLVSGYEDGSFIPLKQVTRAELAAMIVSATDHIISYRKDESKTFTDVENTAWYYDAVTKCATIGVMKGMDGGKFEPESPATREQIATVAVSIISLLNSYGGSPIPTLDGVDVDAELPSLYADAKDVSDWAKGYVYLCNKLGVMVGTGSNFNPLSNVTRAECSTVFLDLYSKTQV